MASRTIQVWCSKCGQGFANKRALNGHTNAHSGPLQRRKGEKLEAEGHIVEYNQNGYVHADDCPECLADNPEVIADLAAKTKEWISDLAKTNPAR